MVRNLSKELNKNKTSNVREETEVDRTVIDESGSFVHIIRNSIDHGIEMPEDRIKLGKSKKELLYLRHILMVIML